MFEKARNAISCYILKKYNMHFKEDLLQIKIAIHHLVFNRKKAILLHQTTPLTFADGNLTLK